MLGDLQREALELVGLAHAVRKPPGVPEVDEVLVGQRDQQLVQDRQPADARVEDADRALARRRWGRAARGGLWARARPAPPPERRASPRRVPPARCLTC